MSDSEVEIEGKEVVPDDKPLPLVVPFLLFVGTLLFGFLTFVNLWTIDRLGVDRALSTPLHWFVMIANPIIMLGFAFLTYMAHFAVHEDMLKAAIENSKKQDLPQEAPNP